jgi:hypothetical protein
LPAVLGFEIEPETWQAVCAAAPHIREVSAERIREELVKTFLSPNRVRGFDLLDASGLMKEVLPEIEALKGCEQPPQFHPEGDVFKHTRIMLELLPAEVSVPLVFSVLLHDIGKPPTFAVDADGRIRFNGHDKLGAEMTEHVMTRLRFSRVEIDATVEAVANHMVFKDVQQMRVAKLKRFMARPNFDTELELHRVDCASSHGGLDNYDFLRARREEFASEPLIPPPLITGRDLIALGLTPGPRFSEILEAVQSRQLEGSSRRATSLAWVTAEFPRIVDDSRDRCDIAELTDLPASRQLDYVSAWRSSSEPFHGREFSICADQFEVMEKVSVGADERCKIGSSGGLNNLVAHSLQLSKQSRRGSPETARRSRSVPRTRWHCAGWRCPPADESGYGRTSRQASVPNSTWPASKSLARLVFPATSPPTGSRRFDWRVPAAFADAGAESRLRRSLSLRPAAFRRADKRFHLVGKIPHVILEGRFPRRLSQCL